MLPPMPMMVARAPAEAPGHRAGDQRPEDPTDAAHGEEQADDPGRGVHLAHQEDDLDRSGHAAEEVGSRRGGRDGP